MSFLQRPKTTPCKTRLPRIPCLFGDCEKVHQAGQNKPGIDYFNSKHYLDRVNMPTFLENTKRLHQIKLHKQWYEPPPKATKSRPDPGAPKVDPAKLLRKSLPAISLDGVNTLVRRPLTAFEKKPEVFEEDMEDWCQKSFSTIDHGYAGYRDHYPLLMHKYSEPEEKEAHIREFHTKRNSIVVADYSHGVIALTNPDDEFQEFIDLFPEKHKFMEEPSSSSSIDLASHLKQFVTVTAPSKESLKSSSSAKDLATHLQQFIAVTTPSKESLKSATSEGSVMSDSSYERLLSSYRKSHGERRMTLSNVKASQPGSKLQNGPTVWGRRSSSTPSKNARPTFGKGGWLGGRRSSLVDGPMSLLNSDKDTLFKGNCSSYRPRDGKRKSFAGPRDLNTVNLLSVIEEAKDSYLVRSETSLEDLLTTTITEDEEEDEISGLDIDITEMQSRKNIAKLEKFLEELNSDSDTE